MHQNQQYTAELIPRLQSKIVALEQALTEIVEDKRNGDIDDEEDEESAVLKGIVDDRDEDGETDDVESSEHASTVVELGGQKTKV